MKDKVKNILKLIRIHQYIKNLAIFLPMFFAGQITDTALLLNVIFAFVAFSLSASAIYILNDYQDIEEDRLHPKKKIRPLAARTVSKKNAFIIMTVLSITGLSLMMTISAKAFVVLCTYIVLNIFYSLQLKHIAILDVSIVAIGFVLRLFIGSFVTQIPLSMWIIIMTFLLALFMALAKRRDDILFFLNTGQKTRKVIDGYSLHFIDGMMLIMAPVVIVVYILYTTSVEVLQRMQSEYLYLTVLFVILGIMRYLQLTLVKNNSSSPTNILFKDKFMQLTILAWMISFTWIIYL